MALIHELLAAGRTISFEFFPPKTADASAQFKKTIDALKPLQPSFVSVTYGAGGSTRDLTRDMVIGLEKNHQILSMAHLTCVPHTKAEIVSLIGEYDDAGIRNILALSGDEPTDGTVPPREFTHASELVELLHEHGEYSIGVAAHPEGHPRSPNLKSDRIHLADKLKAAHFGITQFFFQVEDYLDMRDALAALGCDRPVAAGIMPVTNFNQIKRFAELSGAAMPKKMVARLEKYADDPASIKAEGVEIASEMCEALIAEDVPGLHFYTLNRPEATLAIAANLGLMPKH